MAYAAQLSDASEVATVFAEGSVNIAAAGQSSASVLTNDGRTLASGQTGQSGRTPVIVDVNDDGADDIVTLVHHVVSEAREQDDSDTYTALTAYTPTPDGERLEVIGQLMLTDGERESTGGLSRDDWRPGYNAALEDAFRSTGVETAELGIRSSITYKLSTVQAQGAEISIVMQRGIYEANTADSNVRQISWATLTYPIIWQANALVNSTPNVENYGHY